jgi:hypothetical protein
MCSPENAHARTVIMKSWFGIAMRNMFTRSLDTPVVGDWMVKRMVGDQLVLPGYR